MNWKHISQTVLVLCAIASIIALIAPHNTVRNTVAVPETGLRIVQLAGRTIKVTVVNTPEARAKGLGGSIGLSRDEGMLFVFDTAAKYQFWMKDMLFPIDILWLSDDGKVVDVREDVRPATYPDVFTPNVPARYVLELPAGFARAYNVKMGDIVGL